MKDGAYYLVGYNGSNTNLTLPSSFEYNGEIISSYQIYSRAFYGATSIISIEVPSSVTGIQSEAFYNCSNLKTVYNLSGLILSTGYSSSGYIAYYANKVINLSGGEFFDVGNYKFGTKDDLYYLLGFKLNNSETNVILPNSFEHNGETISSYEIYSRAFYGNTNIKSIVIARSVTNIGYNAFYNCSNLKTVYNLTTLSISRGYSDYGYVAYYANNLYTFDSFSTIIEVGDYGFGYSNSKYYLVAYNGEQTNLVLPTSFEYNNNTIRTYEIFANTFSGKKDIVSVTMPDSVTAIGAFAFYGCESLTSIIIPDGVTVIGDMAFANCKNLRLLQIGAELSSLSSTAFINTDLSLISVDKFNTTYNDGNGSNCVIETSTNKLVLGTNYTIVPGNVKIIGANAFNGCDKIEKITLSSTITSIEEKAFYNCTSLQIIMQATTVPTLGSEALTGVKKILVPNSVLSDYQNASRWSSYSSIIVAYEPTTKFTATWKNEDGSILQTNTHNYGDLPSYIGLTPVKDSTLGYYYTFAGWDKNITYITENVVYTAKYIAQGKIFNVVYNANYSDETFNQKVVYGELFSTLGNELFSRDGYKIVGWSTSTDQQTGLYNELNAVYTFMMTKDIVLYAQWAEGYAIKYDLTGGVLSENNPIIYTENSDDITLNNPSKTGYEFIGWTGSNGDDPELTVSILTGSEGDREYTANWRAIEYTITTIINDQENSIEYTIESDTIELDEPSEVGYEFLWWSYAGENSKEVVIPKGSFGDKNYTAVIKPLKYSLTYNLNGGTSSNVRYYTVESENITLNNPTRRGYEFIGWTGSNSDEPEMSVTIPTGSSENKSYIANWSVVEYTINYNLNGGTGENPTVYTIESERIVLNQPEKPGYTFRGWTGSNGSTAQKSVAISTGSTGNKNYTANWTKATYNITYTLGGGSVTGTNPKTYNIDTANITLINPTKENYNFVGWTESNGDIPEIEMIIPKGSFGNKSFVANWAPVEYTIAYTLDGGIAENPITYTVESENITLENPSKTGYTFIGWTGSNGEEPQKIVTISAGSVGDKEYTAHFTTINYHITTIVEGVETTTIYTVESENITLTNPTKSGYEFLGWTGSNGEEPEQEIVIEQGSLGDKIYTANFEIINYNIVIVIDGVEQEQDYTVDSDVIVLPTPSKEGYIFVGWEDLESEEIQKNVIIEPGSTGNANYNSKFELINYTIKTTVDGVESTQNYNIESEDITLEKPSKTGYNFIGWTGSNGDEPQLEVVIPAGSMGSKDYVAHFEAITYTIKTIVDGVETTQSYNIDSEDIMLINPSKKGYRFTGWIGSNGDEPEVEVMISKGSMGDKEYTATWEEVDETNLSLIIGLSVPAGAILIVGAMLLILIKKKKIKLW